MLYSCLAIFGISAASVVGYKLRKKLRKKFENYEWFIIINMLNLKFDAANICLQSKHEKY